MKKLRICHFHERIGWKHTTPPKTYSHKHTQNCIGFFGMCGHHKHEALWLLKKCTLYTLCTLILFNPLHLTIGWDLTFIQNELWVPRCCHAHSKVFILMFKIFKRCHQDFSLLHTYYTWYTSLFWVKCGEKWLTYNLFSLNYWF
jgi:hypothetical protein